MPLSSPAQRRPMHTRRIELAGHLRGDGLWDLEGYLWDEKPYTFHDPGRGGMKAGDPIHDMAVRLTVDDERVVHAVEISMDAAPFGTCSEVRNSLAPLVGKQIGPGWRAAIKDSIQRRTTCSHIYELLMPLATLAYQAQALGKTPEGRPSLQPAAGLTEPPFYVDGCHSWRADGPMVARIYPMFAR